MLNAANDAATTTAEQDMDEILAREGFEAAPVDHSDDASKESTTKRKIVRTEGLKKWLEKASSDLGEEETEEAVMPVASEGRGGEDRKSLYQCFVRGDPNGRD